MADLFEFSVKLVGSSRVKTIFESDGFWTKHVQDFSELLRAKALSFMQLARLVMKPFPRCPAS